MFSSITTVYAKAFNYINLHFILNKNDLVKLVSKQRNPYLPYNRSMGTSMYNYIAAMRKIDCIYKCLLK